VSRVTLYAAVSLDGSLADADGGVEWLEPFTGAGDWYEAFLESVDCLVMGSRTYEQVLSFGPWPYGDRPTYVLTGRELPLATEEVHLVGSVGAAADRLAGHAWLVGGAATAGAFLRAGLVDEIRLTVVPVVLGEGVALFGDAGRAGLELLGSRAAPDGSVELRYRVGKRDGVPEL